MKIKIRVPSWFLSPTVMILGALVLVSAAVSGLRFAKGIGAVSNLSNAYPWGFWISFDIYTGVALGAGAFTMAAVVYIFNLKRFLPLVRPSILTGFLGYSMAVVALLVDLGRPERIWHMLIYQNHHSFLFEIGICVMTYTSVLALEFAPVLLEGFRLQKVAHWLHHWLTLPLVILGVVLSTLHQSSLGSLTLLMPEKLHPLWWTPFLPLLFFVSAVTAGLGMVIVETSLTGRALHRPPETDLLSDVAGWAPYAAGLYLALRFGLWAYEGKLGLLFEAGSFSLLAWAEVILIGFAPIALFARKSVRSSPAVLVAGALSIVLGVVLNRFDTSWLALGGRLFYQPYVPNWMEVSVSVGLVAAGVLAFLYVALHFPLFEEPEAEAAEAETHRVAAPRGLEAVTGD
jgi:Ni/Fe-hydrogenase subunit HybB-like protein